MQHVGQLVVIESEHATDGPQHLLGRVDVTPLLEPRVPGDADASELGDLFTPQPGCAPPAVGGEADLLRRDPSPTRPQERSELAVSSVHDLILPLGRRSILVLLVPVPRGSWYQQCTCTTLLS